MKTPRTFTEKAIEAFRALTAPVQRLAILFLVLLLGSVNYILGSQIHFPPFYVIPVAMASWFLGRRAGFFTSASCAMAWHLSQHAIWPLAPPEIRDFWNMTMRFLMFAIVTITLTELRKSLSDAERARVHAENEARRRSEFLDDMSHEMRTPLNVLLGMSETLMETELNAEQTNYVLTFQREGEGLLHLINNLLDSSKIEAGHYRFSESTVDLHAMCERLVSILQSTHRKLDVVLRLDYDPSVPHHILTDPNAVRSILLNLLGNALKFTDRGEVLLSVKRDPSANADSFELKVADTGAGIPPERLQSIFERFRQRDHDTEFRPGSSGLGLNISATLARSLGGSVNVSSKVGEGSTFTVTLPFRPAESASADASSHPEAPAKAEFSRLLRILIAEDHRDNWIVYEAFLKDLPFELKWARDGIEAVRMLQSSQFDIVLMDVRMPNMDGLAATREIRRWEQERSAPATPVIAVTAQAFPADIAAALDAGCNGHFAKPFRKWELINLIQHFAGVLPTAPAPAFSAVPAELKDLVADYLTRTATAIEAMKAAVERDDLSEVREISHTIRGSAGSYGLARATELAGVLEEASAAGDKHRTADLIGELAAHLDEAGANLQSS